MSPVNTRLACAAVEVVADRRHGVVGRQRRDLAPVERQRVAELDLLVPQERRLGVGISVKSGQIAQLNRWLRQDLDASARVA